MSTSTPAKQYFLSIDGLRLIASANIVLFHLQAIGGLHDLGGTPAWLFRIIKGPAFHATLFFMLAGFIYTVKYAKHADSFNTGALIKGRLRDLLPLHAVTTLLMVPLTLASLANIGPAQIAKMIYSCFVHLSMLWSFVPFFTYSLNRPSWALSAFFLCYFLFGPVLRRVVVPARRRKVVLLMFLCAVPGLVWSAVFAALGRENLYAFFHVFAPIRFFEFLLGMLLARLYYLNNAKPRRFQIQDIPWLNDLLILSMLITIFVTLRLTSSGNAFLRFASYHVFVLPLYATLLYRLARGNGLVARLFAIPTVRNLGKCSFYPYLLHIPLISWTCWISGTCFGYRRFLHSPLNVGLFMVTLYTGSYLFWLWRRKHKKPTYREARAEGRVEPVDGRR